MEQPWERRWPLLLLTFAWPEKRTKYWVVLNDTLVTRGFFSRAAGCFGSLAKGKVTRGEAATKKREKKSFFAWVTIKTLPYRKLRIKCLWALRVIEPLFWKIYIDDVFFLWKTCLKIESFNRGKGKYLSLYSYYQIHGWDVKNRDHSLGHKTVLSKGLDSTRNQS